ncbi:MAG: hypothetical protein R3C61_16550 [Bacteroidia bacterium]
MLKTTLGFLAICLVLAPIFAQSNSQTISLEEIINETLSAYPLTTDNRFKLAAYTELKGRYAASVQTLTLNFGGLGFLNFYQKNCLLRTGNNQVFSLNRNSEHVSDSVEMNRRLEEIFEKIILLGNHNADPEKIEFVDTYLAKKNIEPFEKVFLRHIFIRFGRYNAEKRMIMFHTDWLPERTFSYRGPDDKELVKRHITPLKMVLSENTIRGYYLENDGTVFVENVDRDVFYATGEEYLFNVAAFKLFAQKLFVQSVQYISKAEAKRLETVSDDPSQSTVITQMVTYDSQISDQGKYVAGNMRQSYYAGPSAPQKAATTVQPLYHEYSWIPMMLGIMRSNNINIGDDYVIKYFIDEPYFDRIYQMLTREEKAKVDKYKSARI